jgi:hypothetical protein
MYVVYVAGGAIWTGGENAGDLDTVEQDQDPVSDFIEEVMQENNEGPPLPPQEAIDACVGSNVNDPCTIMTPNSALSGQCLTIGNELACVPY